MEKGPGAMMKTYERENDSWGVFKQISANYVSVYAV